MTRARSRTLAILVLIAALASGCRSDDLLYLHEPQMGPSHALSHKIKDISGNSDVDILWVIDNSGSMKEYQQHVIINTLAFMQNFTANTGLRWKMGLLSTDTN